MTDQVGTTVIRPTRGFGGLGLHELWRYRELLLVLTWKNVLVRYKQTVLGVAWAVVQPLLLVLIFTVIFAHIAGVSTNGIPAPLFYFAAVMPWTFFQSSLTQSSMSLVANANMLRKIYFPRLVLPLSSVVTALVDLAVAGAVYLVLMLIYGRYPGIEALLLPPLVLLAVATALGAGVLFSAVNVAYRDVQYVVPFLTQLLSFASFVQIPANLVAEPWRTLFGLNPMAGVVTGFRWALLQGPPPGAMLGVSTATALLLLLGGTYYFKRTERTFADVV